MSRPVSKKVIHYRDLFVGDFWRYFLRAVWLFFPAILFLFFAYMCFWQLSQGKDVMIITLENRKVFGLFLLALTFWVMITWYTTRLVAKAKELLDPDVHLMWSTLRVQGPRILAFTCITIIILAFFQLPYPETPKLSATVCNILFWFSFSWYFFVYQFWNKVLECDHITEVKNKIRFWQRVRLITYILLTAATLIVVLYKWIWGLIILLLGYQVGFVIIILIRRNIIDAMNDYSFQNPERYQLKQKSLSLWKKIKQLVGDKEDKRYFQALNIVSFFAAIVYFSTIFSVQFSTWIGSFPFLLLAFGVLLGLGNAIALLSVLKRFNFHILFLTLAILVGNISEPHYTRLTGKGGAKTRFDNRQDLKAYFTNWLNDPERKKILLDSASGQYPVYFVMANGGASRSGYWTASVLSRMEDETGGAFSKHLFCLSGASGGSVGNATFFSILLSKEALLRADTSASPCVKAAKQYLESDFLTYTLARTLGPDIFRNFITLYNVNDRASALSFALENAAGKKKFLNNSLSVPFSSIMTQQDKPYTLPVLFINTTRMQDGSPGVISNIKINDAVFNKRIDVLGLLDEKKDMRLSTAVVLGASFPYLSPAGRIDHKPCDTCASQPNYFVDGGYFDNSGAGAVFEMIFTMRQLLETPEFSAYRNKLDFTVLHITNDPEEAVELSSVNPLTNDLAAPVKTLLGAYGTQTSVNDIRLQKYISSLYKETDGAEHYKHIALYRPKDPMNYTMSWVISRYVLDAMDKRLYDNADLSRLIEGMKRQLK
jgi:hypothetical protein